MRHGVTIKMCVPPGNLVEHSNVGHADTRPSGAVVLWDTNGDMIRTYGPTGYLYWEEVKEN